jgi:hypothetical protein
VGDSCGVAKVACPLHKRTFALHDGRCLSGEGAGVITFPVKVEEGEVFVELPSVAELERILSSDGRECELPRDIPSAAE